MGWTIFNTPVLSPLLRIFGLVALKILGWKIEGEIPNTSRFVMVAHPHTSNFDLPYMLAVAFVFKVNLHWIGKEELFKGWQAPIMTWLGGLPIIRGGGKNEVDRIARHFEGRDQIGLAIVPGGTRSKSQKWLSGFYWIAIKADVPILLSYLDYKVRRTGVGPLFSPTGDYDKDLEEMQTFYKGMEGKYLHKT